MIEMRWKIIPADPKTFTDQQRILQYRYKYPKEGSRVTADPMTDWTWSEWQDVQSAE